MKHKLGIIGDFYGNNTHAVKINLSSAI